MQERYINDQSSCPKVFAGGVTDQEEEVVLDIVIYLLFPIGVDQASIPE